MKDTTKNVLEKIEEIIKYQDEIINTCKKIINSLDTNELEIKTETKEETVKKYTKEDIRGILASKAAAGFGTEVKELLKKYGADKLSSLKEEAYVDVIKEAEVIGNE